jgi:hypothetical protein
VTAAERSNSPPANFHDAFVRQLARQEIPLPVPQLGGTGIQNFAGPIELTCLDLQIGQGEVPVIQLRFQQDQRPFIEGLHRAGLRVQRPPAVLGFQPVELGLLEGAVEGG